ncbi:hypothetical protein, partial [Caballeronia arationis]|uniref:hypothetical protein n=1 Tax=Caballeronia arationis TaxID=1777142 RepID=UPI001F3CA30F
LGFTAFVDRRAHKGYLCCTEYPVKKTPTDWSGFFFVCRGDFSPRISVDAQSDLEHIEHDLHSRNHHAASPKGTDERKSENPVA